MKHLVLTAAILAGAACGGDAGVTGSGGEWVQGRTLSIRVTPTNMGGTMEVRNDSDHDGSFATLKISVNGDVVVDMNASSPDEGVLHPGDSFTFPIMTTDEMDEVRVEMGSGADREVFTVRM